MHKNSRGYFLKLGILTNASQNGSGTFSHRDKISFLPKIWLQPFSYDIIKIETKGQLHFGLYIRSVIMNRLNLDFSLSSDEARAEYVQTYIQNFDAEKPLTNSELEKIADYLLWGKNSEGLSSDKSANIELKSMWSSRPIISLDELRESPAFNEDSIHPISETPTKTSKQKFINFLTEIKFHSCRKFDSNLSPMI